jgi:Putative zinc-finger
MAERMRIAGSLACGLWETQLADAMDGKLRPEDEASFAEHMASCPACAELFEEARRGREWLEFLAPEPEVPEGLLGRILAQTGPGQIAGYGLMAGGGALALPAKTIAWPVAGRTRQTWRQAAPQLMLTAAMAFFSIALTLNLTGVRLMDLKLSDLRPSAVRSVVERKLVMASTPIVRYYDHLQLVYQVEWRMRELRQDTEGGETGVNSNQQKPADDAPGQSNKKPGLNGGSRLNTPQEAGAPAEPQNRNWVADSLGVGRQMDTYRRLQEDTARTVGQERGKVWTA